MNNTVVKDILEEADKFYEEKNYTQAFEKFKFTAENHDCSYSQKMLGYMLMNGLGITENMEEGWSWYKTAAKDDSEAQYVYAWHCIKEEHEKEGIFYMQKATASGCKNAMYDLAGFYFYGMYGCQENLDKSIELYERAAVAGSQESFDDLLSVRVTRDGRFKTAIYILWNMQKFKKLIK